MFSGNDIPIPGYEKSSPPIDNGVGLNAGLFSCWNLWWGQVYFFSYCRSVASSFGDLFGGQDVVCECISKSRSPVSRITESRVTPCRIAPDSGGVLISRPE